MNSMRQNEYYRLKAQELSLILGQVRLTLRLLVMSYQCLTNWRK